MNLQEIGTYVCAERKAQKLSVRAAAQLAEISRQTLADFEAGKHPPSPATQRGIASWMNWEVDWFDRLSAGGDPLPQALQQEDEISLLEARVESLEQDMRGLHQVVKKLQDQIEEKLETQPTRASELGAQSS
ncbi:MAG: helix-turn-helix transcriptional regulator [Marinosulfonomonas sp.]|nr:helix-turn-helix transcriptional regulator [Marinosulfonomonas sp.]